MTRRRSNDRSNGLSGEDRTLWEFVTEQVEPLSPRGGPLAIGVDLDAPETPASVKPRVAPRHEEIQPARERKWQKLEPVATPRAPTRVAPVHAPFDRRKARQIAKGRVEIEARIDLHGLREHEAHMRLAGFLRQAHAAGKRTVLVITGKGRVDDDPYRPFSMGDDRREPGVLRRNVPRWLAEPDLARIVVSYTTASIRHGGEGALYIHLRRPHGAHD